MRKISKNKAEKMHKLVVLSMLMQECLDELNPDTPRMKELRSTLLEFTEEMNDSLKDTTAIVKTTYFQDLCNRVDTVIRKNFDESK
jgi:hypothetical protein